MENITQQPLRLVDGRFMRGNQEVAPEFGNREQIDLLRRIEKKLCEAEEGGVECSFWAKNIQYTSHLQFKCTCGHGIHQQEVYCHANDEEELYNLHLDWEGRVFSCPGCGKEYKISDGRAKLTTK